MSLTFDLHRNATPASVERRSAIHANPGFGVFFTDHMLRAVWTKDGGWGDGRVEPYGPIQLMPSAAVLHYAQEIFEGLKAYRHADGSVWSFRPEANAERMQRSARRLALPELPTDDFVASLRALVEVDEAWVPPAGTGETSLYLRPFMYASEAFLGVRPANEVTYCLIASPAGAYFAGGLKPVTLWISQHYARAGAGGTGAAKTGGNYASSLLPQAEAYEKGCQQVAFLDDEGNLEELGGMNIVLVKRDGTLVTPESDSILEGITRDSILQLATDRGHAVERRTVSLDEWRSGAASGDIVGAFACGTAAVVVPIGRLLGTDFEIVHAGPEASALALSLRQELTDVQYGRVEDRHGWLTRLDA
jgi:branched-chain amino acid aminotransferase